MPDAEHAFVPPTVGDAAPRPPRAWPALLDEPVLAAGAVPWLAPAALDHLGDPDGERVDLLAGRPVVVPRLARGHVRVRGADRVDFLHGQLSQDVRGLSEGAAASALLLDHKGRPQAGLTVHRRSDDLYLAIDDGDGPAAFAELEAHVVFDQVELDDVAEAAVGERGLVAFTLVAGDGAAVVRELGAAFPALSVDAAGLVVEEGSTATVPTADGGASALLRFGSLGPLATVDVALLARDLSEPWHALIKGGARPVGERALTAARVAHGVATVRAEGAHGLPQETGLADRVHYRKGCYLGQEIMARVEARGRLRRGLYGLTLEGPLPALGLAARWRVEDAAGAAVGAVCSAAPAADGDGWWALAVLRHAAAEAAADAAGFCLRVRADGDVLPLGPEVVGAALRQI
ncbi:MAG: folate-binding protein YgfZ [Trueperaceae bacterium]